MRKERFTLPFPIPNTAIEWQLYNKEGAEIAAEKLSRTLGACVQEVLDGDTLLAPAYNFWCEQAEKISGFGACDTEPRGVAWRVLTTASVIRAAIEENER